MVKVVPALACLLFVTACSLAPSGDPDGILIDLEDQWARAVQQGDVAALDTIIAGVGRPMHLDSGFSADSGSYAAWAAAPSSVSCK